jgi:SAM-dependent methyltransferase
MNAAEHFLCSSSLWRYLTHRQVLPWVLSGTRLGDHILEIGAGYGAATSHLKTRVSRVTSLEYDHKCALKLKLQNNGGTTNAVCGDAAQLPFACQTFSSALAILVLHHLKSALLQNHMFAEAFRVLRPGGVFIAFEIPDSWFHRVGHIRSTFTPISPSSVFPRLHAAGFSKIALDVRRGAFRLTAVRPKDQDVSAESQQ